KVAAMADQFAEKGMPIVLVSMDSEERATKAREEWGLEKLPVAYGLTEDQAREWGLYLTDSIKEVEPAVFNEPGTFWVLPDGTLYLIEIASMPFPRPDLEILLGRVAAIANGYPPRGTRP
ncbi:MAG: AhpC/TSA family protein, partial [Alphaproteobacteria bacterium]